MVVLHSRNYGFKAAEGTNGRGFKPWLENGDLGWPRLGGRRITHGRGVFGGHGFAARGEQCTDRPARVIADGN